MAKHYFIIINIALITLGVYLGVRTTYSVTEIDPEPPIASTRVAEPQRSPTAAPAKPLKSYSGITERNLFRTKTAASTQPTPTVDLKGIEPTKLNLKLWGTVSGEGKTEYAVIQDPKNKKQELYRIGDSIENATVKLILREKVILSVDGKDEILEMEKPSTAATRKSRPSRAPRASAGRSRRPISRNIRLQRSALEDAMENAAELLQQARIRPHFEDGEAAGISITGIKPRSLFRKMGLRSGDIITGVGEKEISSVEDVMKMYDELTTSPKMSLQIKRRGREETINYSIR